MCAASALAQISTDGSLGARQSFVGQSISIPSSLGRWVNGNLFHSFQIFNVNTGQTVTFLPTPVSFDTPTLSNIIGRVTGGSASAIQGTIRSSAPGVNLYLINPSGIVFGPGALVDVNGSFYASSAHYLRSADGTRFESRGPGISLTFTTPDGFGFDSSTIAPLSAQGAVLRAREGGTVALVGGGLLVGGTAGATMQALGGNAALVAVASPGVVEYGPQGFALNGFTAFADVLLRAGATVNVNEGSARAGGGSIYIRGANISLDQALVTARSTFGNGHAIDIEAARDVTLNNRSNILAVTTGRGNAGSIRVAANNVVVANSSTIDTSCDPGCTTGNGGHLGIRANDTFLMDGTTATVFVGSNTFGAGRTGEIDISAGTLVLDGDARLQGVASAVSASGVHGTGNGSAIRIDAGEILLRNGGQVDTSSRGVGQAGTVTVNNRGGIRIEGARLDPSSTSGGLAPSGFFSNAGASGNAGPIVVSTRTLDIVGGGEISSSVLPNASGNGGSVSVTATEAVRISGSTSVPLFKPSGIATNVNRAGTGNAGRILIDAPLVVLTDSGVIQSQSEGAGSAGSIRITGRDVQVSNRGAVQTDSSSTGNGGDIEVDITGTLSIANGNTGLFSTTNGRMADAGHGGRINVTAADVAIDGNSGIFAATHGIGAAGTINVRATNSIALDHIGRIESRTDFAGDAGNVTLTAGHRLDLRNGSRITTATEGLAGNPGHAGSISLATGETLALSGGSLVTSESSTPGRAGTIAIHSDGRVDVGSSSRISTSATSSGDGGAISLYARDTVLVTDGGSIASESSGAGLAGSLDVRSGGQITLQSAGRITTAATSSDGGNIHLESPSMFMDGGRVTTAVGTGQGNGGNMEIKVGTLVMRDGTISANAFGGDGGNIHITADPLIKSADSSITASSALGVDGTISLDSPVVDPTGQLLAPKASFLDAGAILAGRCGPRLAGRASSLVIVPFAESALPGGLATAFDRGFLSPTLTRTPPACEPSPSS
jgi:filamentous hemagglutinin family protein